MDDRIVLRSVSYYEGNVKLVSLPRLTIPLKDDERLELPKIGYGAVEGWHVKGQITTGSARSRQGRFTPTTTSCLGRPLVCETS